MTKHSLRLRDVVRHPGMLPDLVYLGVMNLFGGLLEKVADKQESPPEDLPPKSPPKSHTSIPS